MSFSMFVNSKIRHRVIPNALNTMIKLQSNQRGLCAESDDGMMKMLNVVKMLTTYSHIQFHTSRFRTKPSVKRKGASSC